MSTTYQEFYQINENFSLRKIDLRDSLEIYQLTKSNLRHLQYLEWSHLPNYNETNATFGITNALLKWDAGKQWTYEILEHNKIIGDFQIRPTALEEAFEMGYWIDYKHRLQGIVTRVINYVCQINKKMGKKIAVLLIRPDNIPSIKLAYSLGFIQYTNQNNPFALASYNTFVKQI
ncbi:GNAT family N-acetyltransferase [[Mycoplasma] testudinis]|uniref:GNAT family N-acetyltransferase n=1 Tax=[Mycoplasma] testudinis TaxID=33924 RepID=UPI00047FD166|nr:GNAT family protein [[Mycoplasma] testudinis]